VEKYELRDLSLQRMGAIIHAIDVPPDEATSASLVELAEAFDRIRDSALSDDERLIQGGVICERLYLDCGGSGEG
jgi:hypothetical protein